MLSLSLYFTPGKISSSGLNSIVETFVKAANFVVLRSSPTHRKFKSLLEETENRRTEQGRGTVLNRSVSPLDVISVPRRKKNKLMFLSDITTRLGDFNVHLQGMDHTILESFERWLVTKIECIFKTVS